MQPHHVEWTPEKVSRFWDFYSSNPALQEAYFARMVGPSLLRFVAKRIKIGQAIDIGCGPGDLIQLLMAAGYEAYGADSSPGTIEQVQRRFGEMGMFGGAVLMANAEIDLPNSSVDTAFMLEVVEHMDDDMLFQALAAARQVLRPGGHLVLTTPNQENLEANQVICPDCAAIFHRVQHVRAWSSDSLRACVEAEEFETVACEATTLSPYKGVVGAIYRTVYPLARHRKPHLVYIGRK